MVRVKLILRGWEVAKAVANLKYNRRQFAGNGSGDIGGYCRLKHAIAFNNVLANGVSLPGEGEEVANLLQFVEQK